MTAPSGRIASASEYRAMADEKSWERKRLLALYVSVVLRRRALLLELVRALFSEASGSCTLFRVSLHGRKHLITIFWGRWRSS
jgi:hypothetical protein